MPQSRVLAHPRFEGYADGAMATQRTLRSVPTAAVAAVGVLVAHWLTYLAALPQVRARDVLLAATGHGYWPGAVRLVVALAGCGLAALLLSNFGTGGQEPQRLTFSGLVLRLAPIQCAAFLAMECIERLIAHAPVSSVLSVHVLVLGVAIQTLIAGLGAFLLGLLDRAVAGVIASLRRRAPRLHGELPRLVRPTPFRPRPALAGSTGLRGPPLR
jgi:hypothetical protein